jgi:hypothetical protein
MLLYIDGRIIEIRPGEYFTSDTQINIRYLEEIRPVVKKTRTRKKKDGDES